MLFSFFILEHSLISVCIYISYNHIYLNCIETMGVGGGGVNVHGTFRDRVDKQS